MSTDKELVKAARTMLAEHLPAGSTVYTVLKHVSRSGMSRTIAVLIPTKNGISDVSWAVAALGVGKFDRERGGVKVGGCGMDMGVHLVYNLSSTLFPSGFDCPEHPGMIDAGLRCPSNDHSNPGPDRARYGHGVHHQEGGYALNQQWL